MSDNKLISISNILYEYKDRFGKPVRRFSEKAINAVEKPGGIITRISRGIIPTQIHGGIIPTQIHGEMSCKEFYTRLLEFVQYTEPNATIEDLHCLILYFPGGKIAYAVEPIGTAPLPPLPPGLVRIRNKLD